MKRKPLKTNICLRPQIYAILIVVIVSVIFTVGLLNFTDLVDKKGIQVDKIDTNDKVKPIHAVYTAIDGYSVYNTSTSSNKYYNFENPDNIGAIIDSIADECNARYPIKICDLVYSDVLLRTGLVSNENLYSEISENLTIYVNGDYDDEAELAKSVYQYVEALDKIAGTGTINRYCPIVAETFFIMMANERGLDIFEESQRKVLHIWSARACGLPKPYDIDFKAYDIDPTNITIGDLFKCGISERGCGDSYCEDCEDY